MIPFRGISLPQKHRGTEKYNSLFSASVANPFCRRQNPKNTSVLLCLSGKSYSAAGRIQKKPLRLLPHLRAKK